MSTAAKHTQWKRVQNQINKTTWCDMRGIWTSKRLQMKPVLIPYWRPQLVTFQIPTITLFSQHLNHQRIHGKISFFTFCRGWIVAFEQINYSAEYASFSRTSAFMQGCLISSGTRMNRIFFFRSRSVVFLKCNDVSILNLMKYI